MLVNTALHQLAPTPIGTTPPYRRLDLHGDLHPDEKSAFRDLAVQLAVSEDYDRQTFTSNADALVFLLAKLRTPDANSNNDEEGTLVPPPPLIVVLDAFESFAAHPRQTLLYTLLDAVQAHVAVMAVVGMSTRLDVVSHLEKRVRSRFSHRTLTLPQLPLADFEAAAAAMLDYDAVTDTSDFSALVAAIHATRGGRLAVLRTIALPAAYALSPTSPSLNMSTLWAAAGLVAGGSATHGPSPLVVSASPLHAALLAAATVVHACGHDRFTLAMMVAAYTDHARRSTSTAVAVTGGLPAIRWPAMRAAVSAAFLDLVAARWLVPATGGSMGATDEANMPVAGGAALETWMVEIGASVRAIEAAVRETPGTDAVVAWMRRG
ncbi:hypothetical protein BC828DRAFT_384833 [Blastocladiella britannica]|nr:hypothetical protein BC828DRAFT_384833 [Blastocladiella britannica]